MESNSVLGPEGVMELAVEKLAGMSKKDDETETAPFLILVFTLASESAKKPRKRATPAKKVRRELLCFCFLFSHAILFFSEGCTQEGPRGGRR